MAGVTVGSMRDARDAEDQRLLDAGQHSALVESYYGVILDRCHAKVWPADDALVVAQEVVVRLLGELRRGRRYRVPFRVVVHQVIGWKIKEHFAQGAVQEVGLEDWLASVSGEPSSELEDASSFDSWLDGLTELEQTVVRLRYDEGFDFQEIARRLGKDPNAVHQAHFRALQKLRRKAA